MPKALTPKYFNSTIRAPKKGAAPNELYLVQDNWDDYGFKTSFDLYVSDTMGYVRLLGRTKIAKRGADSENPESSKTMLPARFQTLSENYFSIGQDPELYSNLVTHFGRPGALKLLSAIGDLTLGGDARLDISEEPVIHNSLFRFVNFATPREQYARILHGGPILEGFNFSYQPTLFEPDAWGALKFATSPSDFPATNVHALIGANGVGKTTFLSSLRNSFDRQNVLRTDGRIRTDGDGDTLSGVLSIRFSPFEHKVLPEVTPNASATQDVYLHEDIAAQFEGVLSSILNGSEVRRARLRRALLNLQSDSELRRIASASDEQLATVIDFTHRSSGHKFVLLAIVSLVAHLGEKVLVLVDEPETHLHPPLLAGFMRVISALMAETNGLAIVATHSPITLQEIPSKCVFQLQRRGDTAAVHRLDIETYGENVSVLTHEVFGLELLRSGFYADLEEVAKKSVDYETAVAHFGGSLGSEARLVLRSMFAVKSKT